MSRIRVILAQKFTAHEIQTRVHELGPWFHNLSLSGVQTAPDHFLGDYPAVKWHRFEHALPKNLTGMTVLDIGCNGGFYSIQMKLRGASRVLGIDHDNDYLKQARFAAEVLNLDISFNLISVYDVGQLREHFDLVLFLGVFYHLRHPLLALDLIRHHVAKDWFIFQSMLRGSRAVPEIAENYLFSERAVFEKRGFPKLHFIENSYSDDSTNWWIPNRACAEALLRSAGFRIESAPESEVFVCRCDQETYLQPLPLKVLE